MADEIEFPPNTPVRARLIPRHRLPEIEVYRLGEGMAATLEAARWIAQRCEGYTVPYCDDTGLLMRHGAEPDDPIFDPDTVWNEWMEAGSLLVWTPPGTPDGGLHGTVGKDFLREYEVVNSPGVNTSAQESGATLRPEGGNQ